MISRRRGWTTPSDLEAAAERSTRVTEDMTEDVRWIRTYVLDEPEGGLGTMCLYEATGPDAIREHAQRADLPVDEIVRFDECMYTVGLASNPGYLYRNRDGDEYRRSALAFDLSGPQLPQLSIMAFPGEEPPQIECNEDAGGVQTHE